MGTAPPLEPPNVKKGLVNKGRKKKRKVMPEIENEVQTETVEPEDKKIEGEEKGGEEPEQHTTEDTPDKEKEALKKANADLVSQLIDERKKRQLAEAGKSQIETPQPKEEPVQDDVTQKVAAILRQEKEASVMKNRKIALEKFWEKHPEYSPENDTTGILMDTVKDVISRRLNTQSSETVDEMTSDYEDALVFIERKKERVQNLNNDSASTPGIISKTPKATDLSKKLSSQDRQNIKESGMSEEKYLKLKEKYPDVVA